MNMQDYPSENDLISRYVEICNRALQENKERYPYKQILDAAQNMQKLKNIGVCIVDDKPQTSYVLQLCDNKIKGKPHHTGVDMQYDVKWRVSRTYLENVVKNPEEYVKNPAKIDWEWIYGNGKDH